MLAHPCPQSAPLSSFSLVDDVWIDSKASPNTTNENNKEKLNCDKGVLPFAVTQKERIGASKASLMTTSSPFHSLFKVLCIFPSRYLCAIGLSLLFSFRWSLPPFALGCILKQPDSQRIFSITVSLRWMIESRTGLSPSLMPLSKGLWLLFVITTNVSGWDLQKPQFGGKHSDVATTCDSHGWGGPRFETWAVPCSLAVTGGILVSFFSSTDWYA